MSRPRAELLALEAGMSDRPILYDLYCKAGGCTRGYQQAGFEVWGIDIEPQPRYVGERFIQMDALDFIAAVLRGEYPMPAAWHASPPCQAYSSMQRVTKREHPRLVGATRELLRATGRPYAIENVEGADVENPLLLCGTMFGLRVRRHRLFETEPPIWFPPHQCDCRGGVVSGRLIGQRVAGKVAPGRTKPPHHTESDRREAIGVPWMTAREARQAIPPAYTRFVGAHLLDAVRAEALAT